MDPNRFVSIRANIAQVLSQCEPYLVPLGQLRAELNLQLRPPAMLAEFDYVMARMENARQVILSSVANEGIKAKLTDEGRAELVK
jgi:hypothetical protein